MKMWLQSPHGGGVRVEIEWATWARLQGREARLGWLWLGLLSLRTRWWASTSAVQLGNEAALRAELLHPVTQAVQSDFATQCLQLGGWLEGSLNRGNFAGRCVEAAAWERIAAQLGTFVAAEAESGRSLGGGGVLLAQAPMIGQALGDAIRASDLVWRVSAELEIRQSQLEWMEETALMTMLRWLEERGVIQGRAEEPLCLEFLTARRLGV